MDYMILGLLAAVMVLQILLLLRARPDKGQAEALRAEQALARREMSDALAQTRSELAGRLSETAESVQRLNIALEARLEKVRETVDVKLTAMQADNAQKLESIRQTVDEKLHKTLEERLGESFKAVSERLELVHKGLGEMQTLAQGVGDLKRVLTNVKTRGSYGEIQLEAILELILTADQYERNVAVRPGTAERVEFAVRLPGRTGGEPVYLPIDSKFPTESFDRMQEAYELGDAEAVAASSKELELFIRRSAREIHDKYIAPPYTADFALLFLPTEGLYAEVLRRPGLTEALQREYHVVVTGPTTLSALLNSLQMGFRTLAIEKRSSEVWKILGAVKAEFSRFGEALEKTQERIRQADKDIETLIGVRTRQMMQKLKNVEELGEAQESLPE